MKKTIGITDCGEKYQNYERWILSTSNFEVIKLGSKNLADIENCCGIVMTGGDDVHPKFYGSDVINYPNSPEKFAEERDEFEIEIFNKAVKNDLPVLGICRGLQLINCILGGTLKQDLDKLNETHRRISKDDKIHLVKIEPSTLLSSIANMETGEVNSSHHQAIDKLGNGLKVNSIATDGTIEGIETIDKNRFLLAVQWHPERMEDQSSPLSKNIRESFLEAARKI
ncbi:MAG: gamma-glutamyl-gamma-aminobutyrate hydrolase family protein [Bacteroidetes bacterium]|nr:gamma-glutamyl-gamma-aminobutyrate hydrolase family protein [Bacteroidota bacterium]